MNLPESVEANSVNLCDSCCNCYPDCSDHEHQVIFGDGTGNDNICYCNHYVPLVEHDKYIRGEYIWN